MSFVIDNIPWLSEMLSHGIYSEAKIPADDVSAYGLYPDYRWVYCKPIFLDRFGARNWQHGEVLPNENLISKPITNLFGLSEGIEVFSDPIDVPYRPGHFLMPFYDGRHTSTDYVVSHGEILWSYTMTGHMDMPGTFTHWSSSCNVVDEMKVASFCKKWLPDYVGVLNIESIGGHVIEGHLRFSPQFVDFYGFGWFDDVDILYSRGIWHRLKDVCTSHWHGYSVPVTIGIRNDYRIPAWLTKSVDKCIVHSLVDDDGNIDSQRRVAIVNGPDLPLCLDVARDIRREFLRK